MKNMMDTQPELLFVDDFESNLMLFKAHFGKDYNVSVANSGEMALEILKQKKFAVILSDQRMPGISGIELLEIVKIEYPDTMRYILTANSDYETLVASIHKAEIYGFFNKPYDAREVRMSLNKAIEVHNQRISNKEMMEDLQKMNSELRDIDRSKTRYLIDITNEIRTPVKKIMSRVQVRKDRPGSNDLRELLNLLDTSVSRLESFSYAANQLVRLKEKNISTIEKKEVSLRGLIEHCILENKHLLDRFKATVEINGKIQDLQVKGEPDLLISCLSILLENTLNHIGRIGNIKILCGESDRGNYLEIIDQWTSHSGYQIDKLNSFFSENNNSTDFSPGIDLILAKQIMESHNGRIIIDSDEERKVSIKMVFPVKHSCSVI